MTAFEGNRVDMACNATNDADANIPVQINWYNGTELIKPREQYMMIKNEQSNATGKVHSILTLNPINYTNDGEYVCRAFNHPLSFTESRIKLTIECKTTVSTCKIHACFIFKIIKVSYSVRISYDDIKVTTSNQASPYELLLIKS